MIGNGGVALVDLDTRSHGSQWLVGQIGIHTASGVSPPRGNGIPLTDLLASNNERQIKTITYRTHGRELSAFGTCLQKSLPHIARDFERFGNASPLSHQTSDRLTRG
jgi:hypothetical protein